ARSHQYRTTLHSLRLALLSCRDGDPRRFPSWPGSPLVARATLRPMDQSSRDLAHWLRLLRALPRIGLGGGLVGQHRIRAMDPTAMAKVDYSRDCLAGGAFP